jgi:hypothetical protein
MDPLSTSDVDDEDDEDDEDSQPTSPHNTDDVSIYFLIFTLCWVPLKIKLLGRSRPAI